MSRKLVFTSSLAIIVWMGLLWIFTVALVLSMSSCGPVAQPMPVNPGGLTVTVVWGGGYAYTVRILDMPEIIKTGDVPDNTYSLSFDATPPAPVGPGIQKTYITGHQPDYVFVILPSGLYAYTRGRDYWDKLEVRYPQ